MPDCNRKIIYYRYETYVLLSVNYFFFSYDKVSDNNKRQKGKNYQGFRADLILNE